MVKVLLGSRAVPWLLMVLREIRTSSLDVRTRKSSRPPERFTAATGLPTDFRSTCNCLAILSDTTPRVRLLCLRGQSSTFLKCTAYVYGICTGTAVPVSNCKTSLHVAARLVQCTAVHTSVPHYWLDFTKLREEASKWRRTWNLQVDPLKMTYLI